MAIDQSKANQRTSEVRHCSIKYFFFAVTTCVLMSWLVGCATHQYYVPTDTKLLNMGVSCGTPYANALFTHANPTLRIFIMLVPTEKEMLLGMQIVSKRGGVIAFENDSKVVLQSSPVEREVVSSVLKLEKEFSWAYDKVNSSYGATFPIAPVTHAWVSIPSLRFIEGINEAKVDFGQIQFDLQSKKTMYTCLQ